MLDKRILALDLGTTTGYCLGTSEGGKINPWDFLIGSQRWGAPKEVKQWGKERWDRRLDPRLTRFNQWLYGPTCTGVDIVVFEDVEFMHGRKQAQLWSSFRTAVWLRFSSGTLVECVSTGKLKMFATGKGNAQKGDMVQAAIKKSAGDTLIRRFGLAKPVDYMIDLKNKTSLDDNAADAFHLFLWANQNLIRTSLTKS